MSIPKEWSTSSIGAEVSFKGGSQPPKSTFSSIPKDGYVRLIQIRDYKTDKFATYIPKDLAQRWCTKNDIMIGRYGPPIFQILRGIEGAYNVALIKAVAGKNVSTEYLYYFLQNKKLFQLIDSLSQRTSGQTGIDMDALKSHPFPLPPLPEQRKIAEILGTWDRAIDKLEALIDTKEKRKRGLVQQLLTGKTRLSGFQREWKTIPLRNTGSFLKGAGISKSQVAPHGINAIRYGEIYTHHHIVARNINSFISEETADKSTELKTGDIIFACSGETSKEIGKCVAYLSDEKCFAGGDTIILRPESVDSHFLSAALNSGSCRKRLSSLGQGQSVVHIYLRDLESLEVCLPNLEEQIAIRRVLDTADNEILIHHRQIEAIREQKRGLIQKLLIGEIRTTTG